MTIDLQSCLFVKRLSDHERCQSLSFWHESCAANHTYWQAQWILKHAGHRCNSTTQATADKLLVWYIEASARCHTASEHGAARSETLTPDTFGYFRTVRFSLNCSTVSRSREQRKQPARASALVAEHVLSKAGLLKSHPLSETASSWWLSGRS